MGDTCGYCIRRIVIFCPCFQKRKDFIRTFTAPGINYTSAYVFVQKRGYYWPYNFIFESDTGAIEK